MAFLGRKFNENTVEPSTSREPIPAGEYLMATESSEVADTSKNDGSKMLKFTFSVLDGQFKGRKVFVNLNLWNKNKVASEIGWRELGDLCRACGYYRDLEDTSALNGLPFRAKIGIRKSAGYADQNEIKEYIKKENTGGSVSAPVATAAQNNYPDSQEATSGELPPWLENA